MDGFAVVKLNEVIRNVDIVITCTGQLYAKPEKIINIVTLTIFFGPRTPLGVSQEEKKTEVSFFSYLVIFCRFTHFFFFLFFCRNRSRSTTKFHSFLACWKKK